jgi:hypothetical protein
LIVIVGPGTGQVQRDPLPQHDIGERPRHQRAVTILIVVVVVAAIVGIVVWQNSKSTAPVSSVRYVNDTGVRVVLTPCGGKQRCVLEPGAFTISTPPPKDTTPRVLDARTQRLRGCVVYVTGDRAVRISDAEASGASC